MSLRLLLAVFAWDFIYVSTALCVIALRRALTDPKSGQTSRRMLSQKSACMHPLNYMITLKKNHRSSERGKSFAGSVVHVIAVLILTYFILAGQLVLLFV